MLSLRKSNSGVIIIIVLWVLVVLTIVAVGLGRQTNLDLTLTNHYFNKFQTKYYAFAGLVHAAQQIKRDSTDETTKSYDNLFQCGIALEKGQRVGELLSNIPVSDGVFSINPKSGLSTETEGILDEERKINVNGITMQNIKIYTALLKLMEVEEVRAKRISHSIVDWIDAEKTESHPDFGAEDDFYSGLSKPYKSKNRPFDSLEELLLVREMDEEIFKKIKPHVTIFPKSGALKINFDTASRDVLTALSRAYSGKGTGSEESDADSLTDKIILYRNGEDDIPGTEDDRLIDWNELGLNAKERSIWLVMSTAIRTPTSSHLYVRSVGSKKGDELTTELISVINRDNLNVLYWHRN